MIEIILFWYLSILDDTITQGLTTLQFALQDLNVTGKSPTLSLAIRMLFQKSMCLKFFLFGLVSKILVVVVTTTKMESPNAR